MRVQPEPLPRPGDLLSVTILFHYFPAGKDELLLAVAQYEADQVLEHQQPYLGCLDSWDAWQQWRDVV
ncbi:MAG TPA: hypothetical protein VG123_05570, partial [Streptosporangiaceae bacterium]|nr:hypothetical protein [Streptosporangiaceae bacterium]